MLPLWRTCANATMKISAVPLVLATFFSSACALEQRLIFYPEKTIFQTPADVGLVFEDLYFATSDGVRLNGWYIPHPDAALTLLWCHGNAGNISHRVQNIRLLHDYLRINIFIFDYRGYGRSQGSISEAGTYLDGLAAVEFLRERYQLKPSQLVIFGRSLGAAVAAELAIRSDSLALILESPFVSVPEMARVVFPLLPLGPLLSTQYNTVEKVQRVKVPVFILHGEQDEVVPFAQGRKVFDAAAEPKRFYAIRGAGHNDTYVVGGEPYFAAWRDALEWALRGKSQEGGTLEPPTGG
jgi:fermentation-respiration switch protein FrsA (DUF1100 family)